MKKFKNWLFWAEEVQVYLDPGEKEYREYDTYCFLYEGKFSPGYWARISSYDYLAQEGVRCIREGVYTFPVARFTT